MSAYRIFSHPEKGYKAVKRGFSWPAFFFGWIWALSRQLWLDACLLFFLEFAALAIRLVLIPEGLIFSALPGLILHLFFGFKGNFWRGKNLENNGFASLGAITARDLNDALAKVAAAGGIIPAELKARSQTQSFLHVPSVFQGLCAIITLTWKAAFRYRLFWVILFLLLGAVIGLPLLIKHDGTAEGFAQILITYTLGSVTVLLGLCTLWLACGTLARDVEECQIQMVVVKPIARWQVWLGKWIGLVTLNAALLAAAGLSIYCLLEWRARGLPVSEQNKLRSEVLVARGSAREASAAAFIKEETDKRLQDQIAKNKLGNADENTVRQNIEKEVKAELQVVAPGQIRLWVIDLPEVKMRSPDQPLFVRVKFNTAETSPSGTYYADWQIGNPKEMQPWLPDQMMSLTRDSFHEFQVPSSYIDHEGKLFIAVRNPNPTAMLFTFDEGMEVLYREGGFALNLARGLGIILCWMALFAAIGLAAASFLSFPVAAFCSLAILSLGLSSGTLSNVVSEGTIMGMNEESGIPGASAMDHVLVPFFGGMLKVINLVQQFSPVDSLSTGRSISWTQLGLAFGQIVVLLAGILACFGIFVFHRRELAAAQGTH